MTRCSLPLAAFASLPLAAALMWAAIPPAHAWQTLPSRNEILPDGIPKKWKNAKPLAPVWEYVIPVADIPATCNLTPTEAMRWYGCADLQDGLCRIWIASGLTEKQFAVLERHERTHCAGWLHGVND